MSNSNRISLLAAGFYVFLVLGSAHAQVEPCPGFTTSHNNNLACEIPTALQSGLKEPNTLSTLTPTLATQLSQLPNATAISGSGLIVARSAGVATAANESLGTILTQRGDTIGKHNWFIALNYQHFDFASIDGISLKSIPTVLSLNGVSGPNVVDTIAKNRIDLLVHQFAAVGTFGVTDHLDVTVLVPFSDVILKTQSVTRDLAVPGLPLQPVSGPFLPGSANGVNDISANIKYNVYPGEKNKIAIGTEVRFPTGDEANFLGTGAYGVKPYLVFSRTGQRLTPNVNIGYQWNGSSILAINPNTGVQQNLPSSFLYSGGADFRAFKQLTLTAEFLGQAVINGPRLGLTSVQTPAGFFPSVASQSGTYTMDNLGVGFKFNPHGGWLITANTLFALDEGGLRSKVVPLFGVSYRFQHARKAVNP